MYIYNYIAYIYLHVHICTLHKYILGFCWSITATPPKELDYISFVNLLMITSLSLFFNYVESLSLMLDLIFFVRILNQSVKYLLSFM